MNTDLSNFATVIDASEQEGIEADYISSEKNPQNTPQEPEVLSVLKIKIPTPLFSSPELKAQVSFSDHLSSVVCLSVRPSVCLFVRL